MIPKLPLINCVSGRLGRLAFATAALMLASASMATAQQSFKSPAEAVDALVADAKAGNRKGILDVLGPRGGDIPHRATRWQTKACVSDLSQHTM
jgi:hypothetical protein